MSIYTINKIQLPNGDECNLKDNTAANKVSNATSGNFAALDNNGNLTDSGHKHSDYLTSHQSLTNYVQKTDYATNEKAGVIQYIDGYGLWINPQTGGMRIDPATFAQVQAGTYYYAPVVPGTQHYTAFYGLAKAAGDTTQAPSSNSVGNYTTTAKHKIHTMLGINNLIAPIESNVLSSHAYSANDLFYYDSKLYKATTSIAVNASITPNTNCSETNLVENIVKRTDYATDSTAGIVKVNANYGIDINSNNVLVINNASDSVIKGGSNVYKPITASGTKATAFYGLAAAAGDTTQSSSNNAIGIYTSTAKTKIQQMIGIQSAVTFSETLSGTDITIVGEPNTRYICGTLDTLTITPPSVGTIDIIFSSGSTPTVLTATGVLWPSWFDATSLNTNVTYELIITDSIYGGVMIWGS